MLSGDISTSFSTVRELPLSALTTPRQLQFRRWNLNSSPTFTLYHFSYIRPPTLLPKYSQINLFLIIFCLGVSPCWDLLSPPTPPWASPQVACPLLLTPTSSISFSEFNLSTPSTISPCDDLILYASLAPSPNPNRELQNTTPVDQWGDHKPLSIKTAHTLPRRRRHGATVRDRRADMAARIASCH